MRQELIRQYIREWRSCGYPEGIPDAVPLPLQVLQLAPSYKAICFSILRNDHHCQSLGMPSPPASAWYGALKRMELRKRHADRPGQQLELFGRPIANLAHAMQGRD